MNLMYCVLFKFMVKRYC